MPLSNNPLSAARGTRALLVGLAAALVATPALAADDSELVVNQPGFTRSVEVRVDDLDLSSAYDRDTLEIRINQAAREVCDINKGSVLDRLPDARECLQQARAGAMAQIALAGTSSAEAMPLAGG